MNLYRLALNVLYLGCVSYSAFKYNGAYEAISILCVAIGGFALAQTVYR